MFITLTFGAGKARVNVNYLRSYSSTEAPDWPTIIVWADGEVSQLVEETCDQIDRLIAAARRSK